MDVLATNKILYGLIYAPVLLVLYTFLLYLGLTLKTNLNSVMIFNIVVVFFIVFPFYIRYSMEFFDFFRHQSRILIVKTKHFIANYYTRYGKHMYNKALI